MSENLRTTLDLNEVILITNYELIEAKKLLEKEKIFSKIFPAPKTVLEACSPVLMISNKDEKKVLKVFEDNGIFYKTLIIEKDIIWELLKR